MSLFYFYFLVNCPCFLLRKERIWNLKKKTKNVTFILVVACPGHYKIVGHSSIGMFFRIISLYYYQYINILIKKSFNFLFFFQVQLNSIIWLKELLICSLSLLYIYIYERRLTWDMKKAAEIEETMFTTISSFNQCRKLLHTEPPRPRWHVTSGCRFNILWHKILSSALMGYLHVIPTLFHNHLLSLSDTKEKQDCVPLYVCWARAFC